jgi:transposase
MATAQTQELFPDFQNPEGLRVINDRCLVRTQSGHRVVIVSGISLAQYALTDRMAEAHAMISLIEQGWADQNDVARVFGCATRTVRRQQRRFDEGGLAALGRNGGYPRGRARLAASRIDRVQKLRTTGNSYREIARLMGVSAKAIRKLLRRSGWKEPAPIQPELWLGSPEPGDPNLSAFSPKAKEAVHPRSACLDVAVKFHG